MIDRPIFHGFSNQRRSDLTILLTLILSSWLSLALKAETLILRTGENYYDGFSYMQVASQPMKHIRSDVPFFVGQTGPGNHGFARVLLTFDLKGLPKPTEGQTLKINKATLTLYKIAGPAVETTLDLRVLGDGSKAYDYTDHREPVRNWAEAPTEPGGTLGELLQHAYNPTESPYLITFESSIDLTKAIAAASQGDGILRLIVMWDGDKPESAPPGERITRFQGIDTDNYTHRPTLSIDYTLNP